MFGAGALAALALAVVLALGMHRGLLLSSDIKSRCWPWVPFLQSETLAAPGLSDPVWQFVPWLRLARRQLASGELPLWNPHQDGGEPLLGNAVSALLSPLVWPALLLGVAAGWNLSLLLRILLAAGAAYVWLRDLSRSRWAAALGAIAFALSGAFIAWLEHPQTLAAAAVPLLLLFTRRVARSGLGRDVVGIALSTFLVLAGGHPETALMAALLVLTALLSDRPSRRGVARTAGGALLGAGLAAPALFPFIEYFSLSQARLGADRRPFVLPARDLLRFVLRSLPDSNVIEAACAVSIPLLLLAALGLALRADRETRIWAGIGLVMLLLIYDNPISRTLAARTPVHWTRFLLFLPLALAVLGSAGLDEVRHRLAARGQARFAAAISGLLLAFAFVELLWRAQGVHAVTPASEIAPMAPILEFLNHDRELFRVLPLHNFLPPNAATDYALDDVRGYDALASAGWRREREAIGLFRRTAILSDAMEPADLAPGGQALDFWNVKYLLVDPRFSVSADEFRARRGLDLEQVYSGPDGRVFRNRRVLPRARLDVPGSVKLLTRREDRWRFEADLSRPGTFLLADPFFPGWRAAVDGREVKLAARTGQPIAIPLPEGRHLLSIEYRPWSFRWGGAVFFLSAVIVAAVILRGRRSREAP